MTDLSDNHTVTAVSIQLFWERLSNKTVRDNAKRYYGYWGFMVFDWGFRCFNDIEGNITNKFIYAYSFLVGKHREPQSINAKVFPPIIPIDIVAYALTLLWDNLCRNSCIPHKWIVLFARADWLARRWLAKYYSPRSSRRKTKWLLSLYFHK